MRPLRFIALCAAIYVFPLWQVNAQQQDSVRTPAPADTTKQDAESFARHTVYVELLGNSLLGSLNYDLLLWQHLSIRVGLPSLGMINVLFAAGTNGSHTVEVGIGGGYTSIRSINFGGGNGGTSEYTFWTATVAYRYQPQDGGFFFKIGFTPNYRGEDAPLFPISLNKRKYLPLGGISLGYTF